MRCLYSPDFRLNLSQFCADRLVKSQRKTGPFCSSYLHKGPILFYVAAIPKGCKGFQILWKGFAMLPGWDPEAQSLSRGYDYVFFFEVFFATFLVAARVVFFAFFAFLAMSSSLKKLAQ
jgi:hypothetical protein